MSNASHVHTRPISTCMLAGAGAVIISNPGNQPLGRSSDAQHFADINARASTYVEGAGQRAAMVATATGAGRQSTSGGARKLMQLATADNCVYEWQGTAPSCAHGDYCDGGWELVMSKMDCPGDCTCRKTLFSNYCYDNTHQADFGAPCITGRKSLCRKCN